MMGSSWNSHTCQYVTVLHAMIDPRAILFMKLVTTLVGRHILKIHKYLFGLDSLPDPLKY